MIYHDMEQSIFTSDLFDNISFKGGFSTRRLGDGRKIDNILRYFHTQEMLFDKMILLEQIHSSNVSIFNSQSELKIEHIEDTDGIVATDANMALVVRTADCLPVLYFDQTKGVIAASHNGWRGTLKNISKKVIEAMCRGGAILENIQIVFGPSIGECCYSIDEDRYELFQEELEKLSDIFSRRGGKWHLNLLKLNYNLVREAGIKKGNIDYFPFCTHCQKTYFFSFRGEYKKHPHEFGELFSYIMRCPQ